MPPLPLVAVVGGGFSGLMTALHLARAGTVRVRLIERSANFAQGAAYCTANPDHLLNVRAGNMSAWPDQPDHFAQWLAQRRPDAGAFASRGEYGLYLQALLANAAGADGRLSLAANEAVGLNPNGAGWRIDYARGQAEQVDAVVLALGNPPPATPVGVASEVTDSPLYHADPWRLQALINDAMTAPTLLIGSGLTMVDVALSLARSTPDRTMIALSRRGLAPLAHAATSPVEARTPPASASPMALLVWLKSEAQRQGWREAIDALRPHTQAIWRGWNRVQRARFLRHARPYWDVHRHRLAPEVAARVQALIDSRALVLLTGRIESLTKGPEGLRLQWRRRGTDQTQTLDVGCAINCTGPAATFGAHHDRLLDALCSQGQARPDPQGLGLEVDGEGRLIGGDGAAQHRLFAVGPVTRGAFWEITAVPDIRVQAERTAQAVIEALRT
ncbi:FAD/NAD(P)-binding protein [Caulobacter sp. ErkDOM-YI]|uniref:FAD/NAD(P)-binding protein n=1 Tax=unclassified Caulobacter TaxID=2648921 RepID=UPI003AF90CCC